MDKKKSIKTPEANIGLDHQTSIGLERVIFFSDAVFAIAITLLVLEIRLPTPTESVKDAELLSKLLGLWQSYMAYVLSFLVIGTFWIGHHRKFHFIRRTDPMLIRLNLLFLMIVAFVPFPSAIISEYSGRTATIFYAIIMMLASLCMAAIWWHASRDNHLVDHSLSKGERRRQMAAPLITAGIFLASIGIAYVNPNISKIVWLLSLVASLYAGRSEQVRRAH
jgi:uncharacterized membrane protein